MVSNQIVIPILDSPSDCYIIPPRCEVIRKFKINQQNDCIIHNHEIVPGVFLPRAIVHSKNAYITVLNTTNVPKIIPKLCTNTEPLDNYNIYKIDQVNNDTKRTQQLAQILKKDMPDYIFKLIFPLINEFSDIFALQDDKMTVNNFYKQTLNVTDNQGSYTKNYRTPHSQKAEIDKQVENLLKNDLIEPSCANYNSPIILVPKKNSATSKYRMCIDFRNINKKIVPDKHPLPRIDDILDGLGRTKFFSVIDLYSGFHQIPLEEGSRDVTSFSTDSGSFRWKVLPFGLNIAPNSFARMMNIAFTGLTPNKMFLYLDDIIIIGNSEQHHIKNLKEVFHNCRIRNLKINPEKCHFFKPEVTFLGHVCSNNGIRPDTRKFEAIRNYPIPHNADATRRFVAMSNFYRKFVPKFSIIAKPLNNLTRKHINFNWTPECQQSFETLRNALINPETLAYPDFSTEFVLTVDASKTGCGAVLSQQDRPIAFASKAFNNCEMNKSTIEQELIAIHWSIKHFKSYLYGTSFRVRSDHKPLIFLFNLKDPSSKLTRLRLDLAEYDFSIEHIPGKTNVVADALSRIHIKDIIANQSGINKSIMAITRSMTRSNNAEMSTNSQPLEQIPIKQNIYNATESLISKKTPLLSIFIDQTNACYTLRIANHKKTTFSLVRKLPGNANLFLREIFAKLNEIAANHSLNTFKMFSTESILQLCAQSQFFEMGNNLLQNVSIAIIDPPVLIQNDAEKRKLLETFHNNPIYGGHIGKKRLHAKLRQKFTWPNLVRDVADFVNSCHACKMNKPHRSNKEPMFITPTPQKPFDRIVVDTIGPLSLTTAGNKYAVTIICDLTKYIITTPIPNKEAATVAKAIIQSSILIYGTPKEILTDMGTEYRNNILHEICKILQIEHNFSTPYHHETVGSIERNHRTFNEYVRAYLSDNNNDWDELLAYFTLCYNTTPHSSFNHKYSPFELVFGRIPNPPIFFSQNQIEPIYNFDSLATQLKFKLQLAHKHAKILLENSKIRNKNNYDKSIKPINLNINDKVLIVDETRNKHNPIYKGPYVIELIDECNVTIFDPKKQKTKLVHKNNIRKYMK